ncbi:MAG: PhoPQ-activated pathogenicity-related family protein [Candidatus Brocadiaceae bacterium]|nr:PhoPQ-activated pathogenicity-related family protein [Candidatus Brocadiaceae bacterium]
MSLSSPASKALQHYIEQDDPTFSWSIREEHFHEHISNHELLLTSQTWRGIVWTHHLSIIIPKKMNNSQFSLLFVTGGTNENGHPQWSDDKHDIIRVMGQIAKVTGSPVTILRQIPNQPLYNDLVEDALIAFTFNQFLKSKEETWPILFPMVKSVVRTMDTIETFCLNVLGKTVNNFVVSGASKRGWTTWLTGAVDKRVKAIAPMVFEVINMEVQLKYQIETWGTYSEEILDYVSMDIQKKLNTDNALTLRMMVDPYEYRNLLTVPKLIFIGTNDPYWPIDAIKHYFNDIPGNNSVHYVPNAGHELGDGKQVAQALGAFFATCMTNGRHPELKWSLSEGVGSVIIAISGCESTQGARLWTATSANLDFRTAQWSGSLCNEDKAPSFIVNTALPAKGFKAFYVDCIYPGLFEGTYSKSTRMFIADKNGIID